MYANGKFPDSALSPVPGGRLEHEAAAAWNARGGPADAGLLPTGSESSYRDYDGQVKQREYWCGRGLCGNAAVPGTSNHGRGICVDLKEPWMRSWIDEEGAPYGWRKTEAFNEWWHVNWVGGVHFPTFVVLDRGAKGKRVKKLTRRLAFIHSPKHGTRGGDAYLARSVGRFGRRVEKAVHDFQEDHGLAADGEVGPRTASTINAVFKRQYHERHNAKPRGSHSKKRRKGAADAKRINLQLVPHRQARRSRQPVRRRWSLMWAARFVAKWEGFLADAYLDTIASPAIYTIGYGHTGGVHAGDHVTKRQALRLLTKDLRFAAHAVRENIHVKLAVRQRIALISLVFNCGPGAVSGSELQAKLNAGNFKGAAEEFLEWSHAGGVVVEGLLNRRREEKWMFEHPRKSHKHNPHKG